LIYRFDRYDRDIVIALAILGLLADQDLHGYELKKQLADLLGPWSSVSFGSLYPALARLEKAGHIRALAPGSEDDDAEPTIPMTGALSGELAAFRRRGTAKPARTKAGIGRRGKKVYAITDAGRDRVRELLTAPGPDDERSFSIRVAFCQQLTPTQRLALFERRRAELTAMLDSRRVAVTSAAGTRRADPYRRLLRDRDTRSLTSDLSWIDELVAATAGSLDTEVTTPAPAGRADPVIDVAPPTLPRPPFSGSILDPSPKAGTP
jgi:DNA-binding PadR family transcriptional regulator